MGTFIDLPKQWPSCKLDLEMLFGLKDLFGGCINMRSALENRHWDDEEARAVDDGSDADRHKHRFIDQNTPVCPNKEDVGPSEDGANVNTLLFPRQHHHS